MRFSSSYLSIVPNRTAGEGPDASAPASTGLRAAAHQAGSAADAISSGHLRSPTEAEQRPCRGVLGRLDSGTEHTLRLGAGPVTGPREDRCPKASSGWCGAGRIGHAKVDTSWCCHAPRGGPIGVACVPDAAETRNLPRSPGCRLPPVRELDHSRSESGSGSDSWSFGADCRDSNRYARWREIPMLRAARERLPPCWAN